MSKPRWVDALTYPPGPDKGTDLEEVAILTERAERVGRCLASLSPHDEWLLRHTIFAPGGFGRRWAAGQTCFRAVARQIGCSPYVIIHRTLVAWTRFRQILGDRSLPILPFKVQRGVYSLSTIYARAGLRLPRPRRRPFPRTPTLH